MYKRQRKTGLDVGRQILADISLPVDLTEAEFASFYATVINRIAYASLEDARIDDGAVIHPFTHIDGASVGAGGILHDEQGGDAHSPDTCRVVMKFGCRTAAACSDCSTSALTAAGGAGRT